MKPKIVGMIVLGAAIFVGAGAVLANEDMKILAAKPGSEEFEKVKNLAGTWKGEAETDGKKEPAEINYKITSNGSAVVETLFPNTPHEMVSVYHDDENGKLSMTHYCAIGNQPQLDLKRSEANKIELELPQGNKLESEQHMHGLSLTFDGAGKMTQNWTCFEDGKAHHKTTISVQKI